MYSAQQTLPAAAPPALPHFLDNLLKNLPLILS